MLDGAASFAADIDAKTVPFAVEFQMPWGTAALNVAASNIEPSLHLGAGNDSMIPPPVQRKVAAAREARLGLALQS
ncbi:hypothetical protein [Bosea sp. TAF32]|uniref:hypothetical protein n=1 Tax=Bosea sp. TAF32 TaxID=3237482 RepID=UPI003F8F807A